MFYVYKIRNKAVFKIGGHHYSKKISKLLEVLHYGKIRVIATHLLYFVIFMSSKPFSYVLVSFFLSVPWDKQKAIKKCAKFMNVL
jgi:hypothetical protein